MLNVGLFTLFLLQPNLVFEVNKINKSRIIFITNSFMYHTSGNSYAF